MGHEAQCETRAAFTDEVVKEIAEAASADVRSVWKRLAGGTLRPKVQARIDRGIAARVEAR